MVTFLQQLWVQKGQKIKKLLYLACFLVKTGFSALEYYSEEKQGLR